MLHFSPIHVFHWVIPIFVMFAGFDQNGFPRSSSMDAIMVFSKMPPQSSLEIFSVCFPIQLSTTSVLLKIFPLPNLKFVSGFCLASPGKRTRYAHFFFLRWVRFCVFFFSVPILYQLVKRSIVLLICTGFIDADNIMYLQYNLFIV